MAETRTELDTQNTGARDYQTNRATNSEDPQRLQQEIAQTRRDMAETLDSIQQRLDPDRLKHEAEQRVEEVVERAKQKVEDATIGRVNEMTDRATRKAKNWRRNMVNTIKENPIPAALVGVGLGWLIMEGSGNGDDYDYGSRDQYAYGEYRYGDYRYEDVPYQGPYRGSIEGNQMQEGRRSAYEQGGARERIGETTDEIRQRVGETTDEVRQRVGETTDEIRHRAQSAAERIDETTDEIRHRAESLAEDAGEQWDELRDETRQRARQIQHSARAQGQHVKRDMQHLMREKPLAVGAAALALGVIVGWAIPATETESRLVGEYRDDLVDHARHEAQAVAQKAQSAAKEAVEDIKEETKSAAKQAAGEVSEESKRAAQRMGNNQ